MNILIAGGAGFIGSNLTCFHLKKKDTVFVIDNLITGSLKNIECYLPNKNFHFIEEDIVHNNFSSLPSFDIIYDLASPASPIQYKKYPVETLLSNSAGTFNLLEFFRISKSKVFVLASTSEIYGDPLIHPQTEDYWGNVNPVGVRSCYDEGKRFAESITTTYIRKFNLDIRIARIFNTYGPNMEKNDGRVISNFIYQALTKKPITVYGKGTQTRSFCYVSDMVRALNSLATAKITTDRIINLGNPSEKSILELANIVKDLTKSSSSIVFKPIGEDDPKKRRPNITKAKTILNWEPTISLKEGLLKTIEYFKKRFI